MDGLSTCIGIIILIAVLAIIFKYDAIERGLFDKGEPDYEPIGNKTMKFCLFCGAVMGIVTVISGFANNKSPFTDGFSSIWGIIVNGLPYVAFAAISASIYKTCLSETSAGRIAARAAFITTACLIGLAGGFAGSIIAIIALIFLAVISAFFKTSFNLKTSSKQSNDNDYDATLTDEHGFERKLRHEGLNSYRDDKGDRWEDTGMGNMVRKN